MPISIHHPRYQAVRAALVEWRTAAKLTQTQLARRLGIGQSYVSKIERGEAYVDVLLFADWCCACGVQPGVAMERVSGVVVGPIAALRKPAKSQTTGP